MSATAEASITANAGNAVALFEGRVLVANSETLGYFQVFDSLGRFEKRIGRPGPGPMEFGAVRAFAVGPDRTIWILDQRNRRLTQLDSGMEIVATYSVPLRPVNMTELGIESLANGDLLLLGCWLTLDNCGVHRWAPNEVKWSFRVTGEGASLIPIADEGKDGSIWVVDRNRYRLFELAPDGELMREAAIRSQWFEDWLEEVPAPSVQVSKEEAGGAVGVYSPRARISDLEVLPDRLLVLGGTGDKRWASASRDGYLNIGLYLDAVIEVLARDDLRVTASTSLDLPNGMAQAFVGPTVVVAESHPLFDRLSFWHLDEGYGRPPR